jgi:kynurenine formamidase
MTAREFRELFAALPHCEALGRWDFLFVAAPLRITGGTGSPLNPLAIF